MSKKIDLRRLRENSVRELHLAVQRYEASQGMH